MTRMPEHEPLPANLDRIITELRSQIKALEARLPEYVEPRQSKEVVFSHDGEVLIYARSVPYVVQTMTASITGWTVGAKTPAIEDTRIAVFVNSAVVDELDLDKGDDVSMNPDLDIDLLQGDKVQVAVVGGGAGLTGLSVSLAFDVPVE